MHNHRSDLPELRLPQALLGWATLLVILAFVIPLGANRPVSWTLMAMAVFGLFAAQVLLDLVRGLPRSATLLWPPALLFIGALAWAVVQTLPNLFPALAHPVWALSQTGDSAISADPHSGYHAIIRLAAYAMVFWIAVRSSANVNRAMGHLKIIGLFSTLLAAFGLWAYWSGSNPVLLEDASAVVSATFNNRNSYATYAALGGLTNLAVYLHLSRSREMDDDHRGRMVRNFLERFFAGGWLFALGTLLCFAAVALTQSRAGSTACVLGIIIFLAVYRRRGQGFNPMPFVIVAAIVGFVAYTLTSGLSERLLATSDEGGRFIVYPLVVEGIMNRPLLGHGLGSFHDTFRSLVPVELANSEWNLAHNSYLENAYELGLPAVFAFYAALIWVSLAIVRGALIRRNYRSYSCLALACIAVAAFHSLFDFSLQIPAVSVLFAFIIGLGWTQSFRRRTVTSR